MSKLLCGITILTVPTIAYGGYYLLTLLAGYDKTALTDFQKAMFRAGHAHAGVLVLLSLIAQLLLDNTQLNPGLQLSLRLAFPLAAVLVSGGFFASAIGRGLTQPNSLIVSAGFNEAVFSKLWLIVNKLKSIVLPTSLAIDERVLAYRLFPWLDSIYIFW